MRSTGPTRAPVTIDAVVEKKLAALESDAVALILRSVSGTASQLLQPKFPVRAQPRHQRGASVEILAGLGMTAGSGFPPCLRPAGGPHASTGRGGGPRVCLTTRQHRWMNWLDPDWTRKQLIPLFKIGHDLCEPAWNGLLQDTQVLTLPTSVGDV